MESKICSKCKINKPISDFVKHPQTKDGLQCRCNQCRKIDREKYYEKNKETINKKSKKYREENLEKLIEYSKEYYDNNREVLLEKKKEYYKKNSKIIYEKLRDYNKKNKTKVIQYKNIYNKEKKKSSPLYKVRVLMRDRLNQFFKYSKTNKNNSTINIIGCSPQFLKEYIENQFQEGMTWDNHGLFGWHIDHIIPLSSAKTEEEIYKLCHYSNLQPLWAKENLKKSNKLIY
jgi:hypothetical protein